MKKFPDKSTPTDRWMTVPIGLTSVHLIRPRGDRLMRFKLKIRPVNWIYRGLLSPINYRSGRPTMAPSERSTSDPDNTRSPRGVLSWYFDFGWSLQSKLNSSSLLVISLRPFTWKNLQQNPKMKTNGRRSGRSGRISRRSWKTIPAIFLSTYKYFQVSFFFSFFFFFFFFFFFVVVAVAF